LIRRWAVSNAFNLLSSPTDTAIWPEYQAHAFIANAQYGSPYNHIVIPAGFSQAPLFFKDAPSYPTYGAAGTIVGHEITHGFDSNGRLWNNDRQFKNWWDNSSVKAFEERAKCFVDQYSEFEVVDWMGENASPNKTMKAYVDGNLTLAENIADAGGINSAYLAWQKHEKAQGQSQLLPGLNAFTRDQLFFVAYGQM
jgi:endothelin-converting enzyme